MRQSSETNCLLGRNWGYDAQGVWVSEGCGGDFATGSTSRSAAVPGEANAYVEPVDQKAAMATVTTGTNREVHYTGMFNAYGSIRTIVGISDAGAQVQDDASRVGFNFTTFGPETGGVTTFSKLLEIKGYEVFRVDRLADR